LGLVVGEIVRSGQELGGQFLAAGITGFVGPRLIRVVHMITTITGDDIDEQMRCRHKFDFTFIHIRGLVFIQAGGQRLRAGSSLGGKEFQGMLPGTDQPYFGIELVR
jgi:hypothetical protein